MYNALKIFTETNPVLFHTCTQQFKEDRKTYVYLIIFNHSTIFYLNGFGYLFSEVDKLKKRDEKWHRVEELAKRNPNFTVSIDNSMSFYTDFARSPINDLDPTIDLKSLEEDTKYHIDTDVIFIL